MVRTGAFGYLQYGFEAACMFDTLAGTIDIPFGLEQKITNWNFTNNRITLSALNQVEPQQFAYGTTRGSLGVDFVLSNPWWLGTLWDDRCSSMCATPDTHAYTIVSKLRNSISIEIGAEQGATDITRQLTGAVVNSVSLRSAIGEVVRGSVDISYSNEIECGLTIDATPGTDTCNFPYTFAYGTLTTTAGTIAELQSFDISINQNSDLLYTHNTSIAVDAYRKLFEITGSFTASYIDTELLRDIYAQGHSSCGVGIDGEAFAREQTTLTITFDNGLSGAASRSIVLTGTGVGLADHSVTVEPNEPMFETLNWQIRTMSVVATNATDDVAVPGGAP